MELFASQDPRSYSLYFDLNIWFRARKVTETFEKRAPGRLLNFWTLRVGTYSRLGAHEIFTIFHQVKYVYFATKQ